MKEKEDNTIDISHMSSAEYKNHMRRLEQLTTCPCVNCVKICDRWSTVQQCEPYQAWLQRNVLR